ncbi:DUF5591 domain-containing protein [Mesorhizobium sp.]|uniref:DUF5591 domain-containing protein n=1 Tax=Mesorhizobium sp. TaxID=1871066 RepID=UPI000FEA21C2|nr:DUF5591 domain-containing protein [Mesorhizobium sp.]RWD65943.1 MAG: hypothetical protein EOS37_25115 [Mesorhizobium sp.]TIV57052.1 MAG: hypothetical protein E5V80_24285 [Mesorhizobium sp.]
MEEIVRFDALRADWFANGNFMARAIQRQLTSDRPLARFVGFPRHWLPLFVWAGAAWSESVEPSSFVPLVSGRGEAELLEDIDRARANGNLRLLVEIVASAEVVLCETLQRIDASTGLNAFSSPDEDIRLTCWHSYSRPEIRALDTLLREYRQQHDDVLFIPCSRSRPYTISQSHRRFLAIARAAGLAPDRMDIIVITSIGPIPQSLWSHDIVRRYDTGVRDIYRLLVQLRALLRDTRYQQAWDLMTFVPYSDLLSIVQREGLLPDVKRIENTRRRNIPAYRAPSSSVRP